MSTLNEHDWEMKKKMGYWGDHASEGLYRGGEGIVEHMLGTTKILPFTVEEIIEAGIGSLSSHFKKLKSASEIEEEIKGALSNNKGYSLIRMGDGELTTLAHDFILTTEEIQKTPNLSFLNYAGVTLPDHPTRDMLTKNLLEADSVGIPIPRWPTFQQLFIKLARYHGWPLEKMPLTYSIINYELHLDTTLYPHLLNNYKVLLIGNRMKEGEEVFRSSGYGNIVGSIPAANIKAVPAILTEAEKYDYDIAFVSAGIAANLICVELAKQGKIAIDFGHLIDELINKTKSI
jgi:hypothetical protein